MQVECWFSCRMFTCLVVVMDGIISSDSAPIVRRFAGQSWRSLHHWVSQKDGALPTWVALPKIEGEDGSAVAECLLTRQRPV